MKKRKFSTKQLAGALVACALLITILSLAYIEREKKLNADPDQTISESINKPVFWNDEASAQSTGNPSIKLMNTKGDESGTATFEQLEDGVRVTISVSGLTPGKHGFHVHENPIQSNDFKSAGGHFNPTDKHHGLEHPQGSHVGDMPNLLVGQDGKAKAEFMIQHATLAQGKTNSIRGRSLIIHAGEDDQKSDPSGNSGDRVMGGNIPQ